MSVRRDSLDIMARVDPAQPESLFDDPGTPGPPDEPGAAPEAARTPHARQLLAVRMRPHGLDEVVGQAHLLGPGTPIRQLVDRDVPMSLVLWGPPGTGK